MRQVVAAALVDGLARGLGKPVMTQAKAVVYYLQLIALPVRLTVEHQFFPAASGSAVAVVSLAWVVARRRSWDMATLAAGLTP